MIPSIGYAETVRGSCWLDGAISGRCGTFLKRRLIVEPAVGLVDWTYRPVGWHVRAAALETRLAAAGCVPDTSLFDCLLLRLRESPQMTNSEHNDWTTPLRFTQVFRQYLWGGRRLGDVLGKPIGDGPKYAESWEVVDHGEDQSVVEWGAIAGQSVVSKTLGQLMSAFGEQIVGPDVYRGLYSADRPANLRGRFPLLVKWLDAQQNLSLQVHPNDQQAALQDPPDMGKSEAWYVADAAPGARVYAGLKAGVGRAECEAAVEAGLWHDVLHSFEPKAGDCIYIPAGTIHAIGAGLLVAEVQQASDTTYRVWDWDRLGDDGRPRALHIEQGFAVADWDRGPVNAVSPQGNRLADVGLAATEGTTRSETLVDCPYFHLQRLSIEGALRLPERRCQILIVLSGEAQLEMTSFSGPLDLAKGMTCLIPYGSVPVTLRADSPAQFLLASMPD